jgi:hypothetical protein
LHRSLKACSGRRHFDFGLNPATESGDQKHQFCNQKRKRRHLTSAAKTKQIRQWEVKTASIVAIVRLVKQGNLLHTYVAEEKYNKLSNE